MVELIRTWILGLVGAAVFCALATELTPPGMVKRVLHTLCGIVMALTLVSPLLRFDFSAYSLNLAKYRENAAALHQSAQEISDELSRRLIEDECRAYILDKAQELGLDVEAVSVRVRWSSEGFWYPVEAAVSAPYNGDLSRCMESELGIPESSQNWSGNENA